MRITFFVLSFSLLLSAGITMNATAANPCPYSRLCVKEPDSLHEEKSRPKECTKKDRQQESLRSPQAKAELRAVAPAPEPQKTKVEKGKREEPARQQSFSAFSFLYYLFYKFNSQDFTSTPSYTGEGELSQPMAW